MAAPQAKSPAPKAPLEASTTAKSAPASLPPRIETAKASPPKPPVSGASANAIPNAAKQPGIDPKAVQPAKPKVAAPKHGFKLNEFIVYPAHGVGQITGVEIQEVAGFSLELFVVSFLKDKMILKVPTSKVITVGMRKLAETNIVEKALNTLSGRARIKRTMWSRRAQEYEAKINSGDLVTIAEVVRDLYRSDTQPEQSYSERQLYEAALDRMAREIATVRRLIDAEALKLIESFLQKGPKRSPKMEAEGEGDDVGASDTEADVEGNDSDVDRAA
ncbi:transcriptional regulator [Methylocystaceae bacterium]|nr:transcriptional regulator [Methylocystaceae bacterium]